MNTDVHMSLLGRFIFEKKFFRFLELEKEISEREQFLNEMTSIGQGQKYNAIIKGSNSKI